jgi:FkbM family methyltransferase
MAARDLIFDLGMHDGSDTGFYLRKGFRVVAVEARPDCCAAARQKFGEAIADGRLVIVERALWHSGGDRIAFYLRSDWSSAFREAAERDGVPSTAIEVPTVTLAELFAEFGVPHYLKCDIEGAEHCLLADLCASAQRPAFVSMEDPNGAAAQRLAGIGYDRFQMVNQGHLRLFKPPRPAREGRYADVNFTGAHSGLFGRELEPRRWVSFARLEEQMRLWQDLRGGQVNPALAFAYRRWGKLTRRGWLIPSGWADVHATTAAALTMSD